MTAPLFTRRAGGKLVGGSAALVAAAIIPGAALANNLDKARRAGELLIATELHFAPFDFTEGGRQVGMNSASSSPW